MTREIKFRLWNIEGGYFIPLDDAFEYALAWGDNNSVYVTWESSPVPKNEYVLMQWTGLKDKNGKEIYEGDVIRFTEIDEDSAFGREDTEVVEVRWVEDIAQFRAVFKSGRRTELHLVVQLPTVVSCEVIGNIYEHPNLLKP